MKNTIFLLILCYISITNSQTLSSPESVEWDQTNNRWLIGNSGNGTILARSITGVLSAFASGMPSGPHGIEILGDKIYACSGGFIRGYNLSNGANVFNLNLGGSFLNGLTTDGVSTLYATDFSAKKIFKIDVPTTTFTTIATGLVKTPNGILCEPELNRCLIVNWGANAPILAINLTTNSITTVLETTLGNCDGITKDSCGNYYVTAWSNNKLNKFNPSLTGTFTVIPGTLSSPADIDCRFGVTDIIGIPGSGVLSFPEIQRPIITITNTSNVLTATSGFPNYQWFYNDTFISGATSATYTPLSTGNYFCIAVQGNCDLMSNTIEVTSLSNNSFSTQNTPKLFPNPTENILNISFPTSRTSYYFILDSSGKVFINGKNELLESVTIDIKNLKKGAYFIRILSNGEEETIPFLKK